MLVFEEEVKPEKNREKPSKQGKNQQQTQPTYGTGSELNLAIHVLMGGKPSHHCAIPAPQYQ